MMPNVIVINAMAMDMILPVHLDTQVLSAEAMRKDIAKVGTRNQEAPMSVALMEVKKIRVITKV
jgi:hypothetical protein